MTRGKNPRTLFSSWQADLPAALVVFLVALPLCLGIALASGAPLVSGVIAGVVGGIVVGGLSGSTLGVSGPAAGLAVIVLHAVNELGFEVFLMAVVLAGLIQLALGFARAGVVAYYFPSSVITGMLAGIGVIIVLKQIPHAFGYDRDYEGDLDFLQPDGETTLSELGNVMNAISVGPLLIALLSLTILILWETKWFKRHRVFTLIQGPLVAVVSGIVLNLLFRGREGLALSSEQLVGVPVAESLAGLAAFIQTPDLAALGRPAVYKTAFVLAVVASLETLLCVEATDKLDPHKRVTPTNRELKAQGVGNIVSGLLGGLPITQVIVRSSTNIQSGGVSKLSTIAHGVFLLASVLLIPQVMNLIPLATLAAVLLVVGYKLAKPELFKKMWARGPAQFIPFAATLLGIVFTDLLLGIGLGLAVAVAVLLVEDHRLPFHMKREEDNGVRFVLAQQVTFLNKVSVLQSLSDLPSGTKVEINAEGSVFVHADVVEIIDDFVENAKERDIEVVVKGLDPHRRKTTPKTAKLDAAQMAKESS
jgi:MFS superfamily sulfate permease-like transporter